MPRIIKLSLIETDELRGKGTENDVMRRVSQLYTEDGTLVLEYDPVTKKTEGLSNLFEHLGWVKYAKWN